ncbi:MAG: N-glycosylase/DNA lyase [Elusimicrobiota bacterium]
MRELLRLYKKFKPVILTRLEEFNSIWQRGDDSCIFSELCFCICTPQSKAVAGAEAVKQLQQQKCLLKGNFADVRLCLTGVRFPNNKSKYILSAQKLFTGSGGVLRIKDKIDTENILAAREWFAQNVKGIGYKEASHFLRNIGLGHNLAILDVHILRNLVKYKVIPAVPKNGVSSRKTYLGIEDKLRGWANKIKIPMSHLDLLLWAKQTGYVFK